MGKNFIYPADKTFRIIRIINFNTAEPTYYRTNFHCAISGEQNGAFWHIVQGKMLPTNTPSHDLFLELWQTFLNDVLVEKIEK